MDDVARYRALLAGVEEAARAQPWAAERPWRTATHVGWEDGRPVVDLHDLRAALARDAVRAVVSADPPAAGAVVLVYGRGRHTLGAGSALRGVVAKELQRACAERPEWSYRAMGAARWVWITDWSRAPGATGPLPKAAGWTLVAAVLWALGRELGLW